MNWLTLFQPVYSTVASLVIGFLIGRIKKIKGESKAERQALGALLRNDMFSIYRKYRDSDEVPAEVQEEMSSLYSAYHGLGFNNMGTKIHDEIMAKPTRI